MFIRGEFKVLFQSPDDQQEGATLIQQLDQMKFLISARTRLEPVVMSSETVLKSIHSSLNKNPINNFDWCCYGTTHGTTCITS